MDIDFNLSSGTYQKNDLSKQIKFYETNRDKNIYFVSNSTKYMFLSLFYETNRDKNIYFVELDTSQIKVFTQSISICASMHSK